MIKRMTKEDHVKMAKELHKKDGTLPSTKWLISHGYESLSKCIYHNPESFKHLK